jgi:uncharacterized membrane protein YoaK (UPF0700 family)
VPSPGEREVAEGLLLSAIAGSVDGLGYVLLRVFTAHITGNTVHAAAQIARSGVEAAAGAGFAIALFVAGVAGGALLREESVRRGWPARAAVLGACALLLALFAAFPAAQARSPRFYLLTALAALAAGAQNAVGPAVGGKRVRTFITGTMTELAEALVVARFARGAARRDALARARGLLGVWLAYLLGAIACAAAAGPLGTRAALLPAAALGAAVAASLRAPGGYSRRDG